MAKYGPIKDEFSPETPDVTEITDAPAGAPVDQETIPSDPSGDETSEESPAETSEGEASVETGTDSPVAVEPVVVPFVMPIRSQIKDIRRRDKPGRKTCGACGISLLVTEFRRAHDEYCMDCKEKHNL